MKKTLTFVLLIAVSFGVYGQEDDFKTILSDISHISGFGGPIMGFTNISGKFGHMIGGGGGIVLDDFYFGGYGTGLTNLSDIEFGHGGLWTGYTFMGNKAIHPSLFAQIGWGRILLDGAPGPGINSDNVFVFSPVLELELNLTQFFRLGIGGQYRFVTGVGLSGYDNNDFSGPGASLTFKFGWF